MNLFAINAGAINGAAGSLIKASGSMLIGCELSGNGVIASRSSGSLPVGLVISGNAHRIRKSSASIRYSVSISGTSHKISRPAGALGFDVALEGNALKVDGNSPRSSGVCQFDYDLRPKERIAVRGKGSIDIKCNHSGSSAIIVYNPYRPPIVAVPTDYFPTTRPRTLNVASEDRVIVVTKDTVTTWN